MNKIIHVLSFFIIACAIPAVLFTSCKKDEISNLITYDGNKYKITGGIIENFGIERADPASYRMGLTLFSDGLTYNLLNNEFSGEGAIFYVNMYSSSSSDLSPGTYVFNLSSKNSLTFDWGVIIDNISYTLAEPDGFDIKNAFIAGEPLKGGTIKLTKENLIYTITFSGTSSSDKSVKANFKGPLPIIDKQVGR